MAEFSENPNRPTDPVGRFLYRFTRGLALFGGVVMVAIAIMTMVSITGRFLFSMPVPGDIEMIAIGTSVAVFAFLPFCQLVRDNVIVDFFLTTAPTRVQTFFDAVGSLLYLIIGVILTWRMYFGGVDLYKYGERTMTLNFPRWMTFPLAIFCLAVLVIVILYTLGRSIAETRANRFFDH